MSIVKRLFLGLRAFLEYEREPCRLKKAASAQEQSLAVVGNAS